MTSSDFLDVVVIGDGLVGLASARACAARGLSTALVGKRRPGLGSAAAAGFLAPTIEPARGAALAFTLAAREHYAGYLNELQQLTGHFVPFALDGILRLPATERDAEAWAGAADPFSTWLSPSEVSVLEPALHAPLGARFHDGDGMVDNQRLLHSLGEAVALGGVQLVVGDARRIEVIGDLVAIEVAGGPRLRTRRVVIANGPWAPLLDGTPRAIPVRPLRGQMMALAGTPVSRPVFGAGGYVVPRAADRQVFVGSTSEAVGYELGTTDAALTGFRESAGRLVPALARADEVRIWSGLRPMTLDGLPIVGPDPDHSCVIYACGHSRNGILLAPLTGEVVAALASGSPVDFDLTPFSIARFPAGTGTIA
ncbi:MAG: FAD-dependent oxidoreductase [Gemmatimonadaceae bacterium]|nr:FAD-dependent oxidoreductase [Gemmatimonadaceae bacterium]